MQTTLKQRVEKIMKWQGCEGNANKFANKLGLERATVIYNVLNRPNYESRTLIDVIANKFQTINKEWLEFGTGEEPEFLASKPIITHQPDPVIEELRNELKEANKKIQELQQEIINMLKKKEG